MKKYGHAITRLEDTKVVESQRAPEVNKDMIIVKKVPVKTCNLQTSRHNNGKKETKMFSFKFPVKLSCEIYATTCVGL